MRAGHGQGHGLSLGEIIYPPLVGLCQRRSVVGLFITCSINDNGALGNGQSAVVKDKRVVLKLNSLAVAVHRNGILGNGIGNTANICDCTCNGYVEVLPFHQVVNLEIIPLCQPLSVIGSLGTAGMDRHLSGRDLHDATGIFQLIVSGYVNVLGVKNSQHKGVGYLSLADVGHRGLVQNLCLVSFHQSQLGHDLPRFVEMGITIVHPFSAVGLHRKLARSYLQRSVGIGNVVVGRHVDIFSRANTQCQIVRYLSLGNRRYGGSALQLQRLSLDRLHLGGQCPRVTAVRLCIVNPRSVRSLNRDRTFLYGQCSKRRGNAVICCYVLTFCIGNGKSSAVFQCTYIGNRQGCRKCMSMSLGKRSLGNRERRILVALSVINPFFRRCLNRNRSWIDLQHHVFGHKNGVVVIGNVFSVTIHNFKSEQIGFRAYVGNCGISFQDLLVSFHQRRFGIDGIVNERMGLSVVNKFNRGFFTVNVDHNRPFFHCQFTGNDLNVIVCTHVQSVRRDNAKRCGNIVDRIYVSQRRIKGRNQLIHVLGIFPCKGTGSQCIFMERQGQGIVDLRST